MPPHRRPHVIFHTVKFACKKPAQPTTHNKATLHCELKIELEIRAERSSEEIEERLASQKQSRSGRRTKETCLQHRHDVVAAKFDLTDRSQAAVMAGQKSCRAN